MDGRIALPNVIIIRLSTLAGCAAEGSRKELAHKPLRTLSCTDHIAVVASVDDQGKMGPASLSIPSLRPRFQPPSREQFMNAQKMGRGKVDCVMDIDYTE